ncbi:MAG: hypothetical protein PHQ75_01625 [Thermoguttaceae bacterium]|nr:hypothetical protein [Thermoguttaceae bacterium]
MFRLSFYPLMASAMFVVLVLLGLLIGLLVASHRTGQLTAGRGKVLFFLRLFVVLLLVFLMFRPAIVLTTTQKLPASLIFLIDQSESMSIEDELGDQSRFELLRKTFHDAAPLMQRLRDEFEVEVIAFDSGQTPLAFSPGGEIEFPAKPQGNQTALGAALYYVQQRTAGKRGVGIVLLSDGTQQATPPRDQLPQDAALRLREALLPVYGVRFGKTGNQARFRDVAVSDLLCNDQVFVNNELVVSGQIRVQGYAGQTIPVQFHFETPNGTMEEVGRMEVKPETDDSKVFSYRFTYIPKTQGQWKLQVSVPKQAKELIETNNELASFVRVVDGGIKILYLEGTRRFEQKYLRMSLDSSADIHVDYWRPPLDAAPASKGQTQAERIAMTTSSRDSLVSSFFKPGEYAALILGDVDSTAFKPEELEAIAARVSEGTGLIILSGQRSLAPGGYAQTKLADLVPVQMSASDRLPLNMDLITFDKGLAAEKKIAVTGPFTISPLPEASHFLTRLSVDIKKNQAQWNAFPPLEYIYRVGELKPGARLLAVAKRKNATASSGYPFLVSQLYGTGRVVLLTSDETWLWWMNGFMSEHKKFWRQLVLWTAKMDEIPKGEVAVELDRTRFALEEPVDFRLIYRSLDGSAPKPSDFKVEVVSPDGSTETVTLIDDGGTPSGTFRATRLAGDYRIRASLLGAESAAELKKAQGAFLVVARNMELDNPGATPSTLEHISSTTGGQCLSPEEFPALLDKLLKKRDDLTDRREVKKTLYDTWTVFALFVAALGLEWFLRKRWGLV